MFFRSLPEETGAYTGGMGKGLAWQYSEGKSSWGLSGPDLKGKHKPGTSLVAQWLRIRLPMQGTRVRALVQEDPTSHGATKPVRHTY